MAKEKFQLEYIIKSPSINMLWNAISSASGLEKWFADKVTIVDKKYTFRWADYEQEAELINSRVNSFIRFRWLEDQNEKYYFQFKFVIDELTSELALIVTDFASPEDIEDTKNLWNKQIKDMLRGLGL